MSKATVLNLCGFGFMIIVAMMHQTKAEKVHQGYSRWQHQPQEMVAEVCDAELEDEDGLKCHDTMTFLQLSTVGQSTTSPKVNEHKVPEFIRSKPKTVPDAADAGYPGFNAISLLHLLLALSLATCLFYASFASSPNPTMAICCWMVASFGMNIVNKKSSSSFRCTCLLVIIQMVCADMVLLTQWRDLKYVKTTDLLKWTVVACAVAAMLATSMFAFKETTMSTVLILRNVLPLATIVIERQLMKRAPPLNSRIMVSMGLALAGTVMYGLDNWSVTRLGILLIGCNCVVTVLDRLLERYLLSDEEFSVSLSMCMLVNNVVGIVPMFVLAIAMGEVYTWQRTITEATSLTWTWVALSAMIGTSMGFLGLRTQKFVSATTLLMLQNINKVALILFGVFAMGDNIQGLSLLGCAVSLCGSLLYGYFQLPAEAAQAAQAGLQSAKDSERDLSKKNYGTVEPPEDNKTPRPAA
eukprot:gnl/TRDRNA2_/TRDRNA2_85921_c0_seq1.p1 gnl/TRDRNA2_/TRDRNA2_85921_c0~~gnl/TRDRNA2_/TRDRNA2_85921_c0_seq1.p1  ORF type:complete len:468 (+),score=80.15 gnl/TRDRNA2_/TRDRNA2_85921_c0_seq1:31-1434(+)